ncbi:MAG TPA: MBL fold metallo-hydrolase [Hellea balneolensis]|uniref:MBL fold metallo-hydrolase n=1 Tax=Hellea balneolensis TaxID=287478 RepID=A0A7C3C9I0_9PROT|nr:MBL fold metallo-hydrolase [Hellea balneolensis]
MRIVRNILLLVFFGLVLVLAIVLVPPHIQTRRIAPSLPDKSDILALRMTDGPQRLSYILTASQYVPRYGPQGKLGHSTFVAEWPDGKIFMVDTGMDKAGTDKFVALMKKIAKAGDGVFNGSVAELLGPALTRIRGIGFTHLHIDHTQGLTAFCTAHDQNNDPDILVYQTHTQHDKHNFNTKEGAEIVRTSCLTPGTLLDGAIKTSKDFPGLGIIPIGGHTPGSTIYIVPTPDHIWILSGDTTNTRDHLIHDQGKGFLYSYIMVPENTAQTKRLRHWLAELDKDGRISVIVSHDATALKQSGLSAFTP